MQVVHDHDRVVRAHRQRRATRFQIDHLRVEQHGTAGRLGAQEVDRRDVAIDRVRRPSVRRKPQRMATAPAGHVKDPAAGRQQVSMVRDPLRRRRHAIAFASA